jgi:cytochrome o ubiquinol oxidase subunit 2
MLFDVHVISPLAFPDWVASTAGSDQILNAESYTKFAQQSIETTKTSYRLADPELFRKIAIQQIAPGPGPQLTTNLAKPDDGASNAR